MDDTINHLVDSLERHGKFIQEYGLPFRNPLASLDIGGELPFEESEPHITQNWGSVSSRLHDYDCSVRKHESDFNEKEKLKKERSKKKVLEWISASKETDSLHRKFQDTRICPDTGRWLFKKYSEVTDWMKEDLPPESAIWLHGSRGYGNEGFKFIEDYLLIIHR